MTAGRALFVKPTCRSFLLFPSVVLPRMPERGRAVLVEGRWKVAATPGAGSCRVSACRARLNDRSPGSGRGQHQSELEQGTYGAGPMTTRQSLLCVWM